MNRSDQFAMHIKPESKTLYKDYRFERITTPRLFVCNVILEKYKPDQFIAMTDIAKDVVVESKKHDIKISPATIYNTVSELNTAGIIDTYSLTQLTNYINATKKTTT